MQPQTGPHQPPQQRPYQPSSATTPSTLNRSNSNFRNTGTYGAAPTPSTRPPQAQQAGANRNLAPAASQGSGVQNYQAPQAVEVYHLQDAVNNGIPPDIRSQFQCDDFGRLLFFTTPPVDVRAREAQGAGLAHSARYIAIMQRRAEERGRKRKLAEEARQQEEGRRVEKAKRPESEFAAKAKEITEKAEAMLRDQLRQGAGQGLQQLDEQGSMANVDEEAVATRASGDVAMVNGYA